MKIKIILGFAFLLCSFHGHTAVLGTLGIATGTLPSQEVTPGELVIDPFLEIGGTALQYFRDVEFSGLDTNSSLEWTINADNDELFSYLVARLSNGQDERLKACRTNSLSTSQTCSSQFESSIFQSILMGSEVDLTGYVVTSVSLTVSDLIFTPWDGTRTSMFWSETYAFEGHPVPVPAGGVLLLSACASLFFRKKEISKQQ